VLWLVNPPLTSDTTTPATDEQGEGARADAIATAETASEAAGRTGRAPRALRGFITVPVAAVYLAAACSTLVLSGTDVSIVAALRTYDATQSIGWVLALWGAGSLVGGLVYGAWHRSFSVFWLLGGLAALTLPVALAVGVPSFAVLVTVSGLLCAPTITATVEQLSRLVPERFRGEMMGWHGSAMTAGSALGAPLAGFAIDHGGWQWGFVVVSLLGVLVAAAGLVAAGRSRSRGAGSGSQPSDATGTTSGSSADSDRAVPAANMEH